MDGERGVGKMGTITGSGVSTANATDRAVKEAVHAALSRLGRQKPSYGFVFSSPRHHLPAVLQQATNAAAGAAIIGCTTAGEVTEQGLVHDGVAVLFVASDTSTGKMAFAPGLKTNPRQASDVLSHGVQELRKTAAQRDQRHLTTVLLTDGLSGMGEQLVSDLYDRAQGGAPIVGGAAGDEGRFAITQVGAGLETGSEAAAALNVFSARPWGVGVNHGLRSTTKQMRVTKASGNVLHELDGEPAFEAYKRHSAERGIALTAENASQYLVANELGIHFFDKISRARAPLSVGADGSLTCAAEIPRGSMVSILDGVPDSMVEAAKIAAEEAKEHLGGEEAAGVLLFDCVCRGMILKEDFHREVQAVRSVFGDVPIAGFLTYGEIARYRGKLDGWHNATAGVAAIPR
jgi:hypothetical protein